jgi:hypothetical protein
MRSPFAWIVEGSQRRVLTLLTVLLLALTATLGGAGRILVTPQAPYGIISFELTGHIHGAAAILQSWSPQAREWAMWIQGLDSLYIIVYPAWLSLAAAMLAARLGTGWRSVGLAVSWLVLACTPLDAVENHALVQQLTQGPDAGYAELARWCAIPKFVLAAVAASFLILAAATRLSRRLRRA